MQSVIRIVLVDDHAILREGLAVQINAQEDMTVVGDAGDAESGIDLVIRHHPDILIMDIDLPGLSCFAAARTIAARMPDTRIIFLSAYGHDRYIEQALDVRAWGYITKGESFTAVREAIHEVAAGRLRYSEDIKARLVVQGDGFTLAQEKKTRASTLTPREIEVVQYLSKGMAVKEIAKVMHLSAKTVDNHKSNMMAKLNIHDRVALTRFALQEGLATV